MSQLAPVRGTHFADKNDLNGARCTGIPTQGFPSVCGALCACTSLTDVAFCILL